MSGLAFIPPRQTPVNSSGRPYASASLTFFRAGTTTPANVYATSSLTTAVGVNGVVTANSAGLFPAIYLDPNVAYRAILKNQAGVTLWDEDNIPPIVIYARTPAETAADITPTALSYPPGDCRRYGVVGDGIADDTLALGNALASGEPVLLVGTIKTTSTVSVAVGSSLKVEGVGGAKIVAMLNDNGSYEAGVKLIGTSSSKIVLKNFAIEHSGTKAESLYGIDVPTAVDTLYAENVKVSGFPYYGFQANADQQTHVNCSYSDNVHAGLYVGGGMILLDGVKCDNNGNGSSNTTGYGVVASGSSCVIKGGRFVDNDRYGIDARRSNNVVIDGAYVKNAGYVGIYAVNEDSEKDASNIKVVNCTVDMSSRSGSDYGIWVGTFGTSSTVSSGEILVSGNTVKNTVGTGIIVSSGTGSYPPKLVNVSDNQITTTGSYGIVVGSAAFESVIVRNNQLLDASEIQVASGDVAQILGNSFTYSGTPSRLIYCNAGSAVIQHNVANGTMSSADGIEVGASCTSFLISENLFGSYLKGSATYDAASLNDGVGATTTVTVTGATLGDVASASFSLDVQGITVTSWVSAANTVSVRFQNESGGTLDLASGTIRATVKRVR